MKDRNEKIMEALKEDPKAFTFTELQKKTKFSPGKLNSGIKSLVQLGKIAHVGRFYALVENFNELEERLISLKRETYVIPTEVLIQEIARQITARNCNGTSEIIREIEETLNPDDLNLLIIENVQDIFLCDPLEQKRIAAVLRQLIDLRAKDGRRLISMMMTGTPGTLEKLKKVDEGLVQRIGEYIELRLFNYKETKEYVHKYARVAGLNPRLFKESAFRLIYKRSKGRPRAINRISLDIFKQFEKMGRLPEIDSKFVRRAIKSDKILKLIFQ